MTNWSGDNPPVLGIDLGTSTCLACVEDAAGQCISIRPDRNLVSDLMPSYFYYSGADAVIGEEARQMLATNRRDAVVRCVKRYMRDPEHRFKSNGRYFTPTEISSYYLKHLKLAAELQLGLPAGSIEQAVVTVPANFGSRERTFTEEAANRAGFDPVHLLDEPIAAAYGLELHRLQKTEVALVVDLGGGTLDVTLLLAGQRVDRHGLIELGRDGDEHLGGDKWDEYLAKFVVFKKQGLVRDAKFFDFNNIRLYDSFERAKRELNGSASNLAIQYEDIVGRTVHYPEVSSAEFFDTTDHLAQRCVMVCERLLRSIRPGDVDLVWKHRGLLRLHRRFFRPQLEWSDIDRVILVGGGAKIRSVKQRIWERWGREPKLANHPQHQVARGAAHIARFVSENDHFFREMHLRSPHSYGVFFYPDGRDRPAGFKVLVHRNDPVPPKAPLERSLPVSHGAGMLLEIGEQRWEILDIKNTESARYYVIGELHISEPPGPPGSAVGRATHPSPKPDSVRVRLDYSADHAIKISARYKGADCETRIDYSRSKKNDRRNVRDDLVG